MVSLMIFCFLEQWYFYEIKKLFIISVKMMQEVSLVIHIIYRFEFEMLFDDKIITDAYKIFWEFMVSEIIRQSLNASNILRPVIFFYFNNNILFLVIICFSFCKALNSLFLYDCNSTNIKFFLLKLISKMDYIALYTVLKSNDQF